MKPIIVLLTLFCQCQGGGCPSGWFRFRGTDRCYYISGNSEDQDKANGLCSGMKGQLVPPITYAEMHDLNEFLGEQRRKCRRGENCEEFWIGIYNATDGGWRTPKFFLIGDRHFWALGFPKPDAGKCVVMSYNGSKMTGAWRNTDCDRKLKFVCITCPDNFVYFPEINECLYFNWDRATWVGAQEACTRFKRGAQMVTIQNALKQDAVEKLIDANNYNIRFCDGPTIVFTKKKQIWMGAQTLNPNECKTPYVWKPYGKDPIPFAYDNWFPASPNCELTSQNCASIGYEGLKKWSDQPCSDRLCYICEFK